MLSSTIVFTGFLGGNGFSAVPPAPKARTHLTKNLKKTYLCAAITAAALALGGCSAVPRGAAIASEVTAGAEDQTADFAVYPVTRSLLTRIDNWPLTGESTRRWLPHSHGTRARIIRPGDTLALTIWDASESSLISAAGSPTTPLTGARVSPTGSVFVPYAGNIQVAGKTPEAARQVIERAMENFVPSAQVQLSMVEGSANTVSLVGGASIPGRYPLPDNAYTILDLLAEGGGIAASLENPKVKLQRGHDLYVISAEMLYESPIRNVALRPDDRVIVEEDDRFFLSLGASGSETVHPFTKDFISATEAVAFAGGVNDGRGDPGGVLILREYPLNAVTSDQSGPQKQRVVFSVDLTTADGLFSARNFRVNSKDLIYVTEAPVTKAASILALIGSGFGIANTAGSLGN